MRPVALTWVLQKNGLASSKGDAQRAIRSGDVFVDGARVMRTEMRLGPGDYVLRRLGEWGEVRVRVRA
jgi:ribosome-associated protein YbcJ (S4-like RNA binding protein)